MTPIPPTLLAATRSGRIHGRTLAVFVELHEWIDTEEFRTVKAWCVAERLRMSQENVYAALRTLLAEGHLETGERLGTARTFRIVRKTQSDAA